MPTAPVNFYGSAYSAKIGLAVLLLPHTQDQDIIKRWGPSSLTFRGLSDCLGLPQSVSASPSLCLQLCSQAKLWEQRQPAAFQKTICLGGAGRGGGISSLRYVSDYEDTLGPGDISVRLYNRRSRSQEATTHFLPEHLGRPLQEG